MIRVISEGLGFRAFDYLFGLYVAGASALLAAITAWSLPEIVARCEAYHTYHPVHQYFPINYIYGCTVKPLPDGSWGYWGSLLSIAVLVLFLSYRVAFRKWIQGNIPTDYLPFTQGILTLIIFMIASLISIPAVGLFNTPYFWSLLIGVPLAVIDGFSAIELNLSFISSNQYTAEVKLVRLQQEHQKWAGAVTLFTAFYLTMAVSALATGVISATEVLRESWIIVYLAGFSYVTVGFVFGVYGNLLGKIEHINRAVLEIKQSDEDMSPIKDV